MTIPFSMTGGLTKAFAYDLLTKVHDLSSDTIKCALYVYDNDGAPTNAFDSNVAAYTTSNEASGSGYSAGGVVVTGATLTPYGSGWGVQLDNITFPNCTVSATQALIYNASASNRAIGWLGFGSIKTTASADFVIRWDPTRPPLIRLEI